MKKILSLLALCILLSGCGGPPSVDELVANDELRNKLLDECIEKMTTSYAEGKMPEEPDEKCANAIKAGEIVEKQ